MSNTASLELCRELYKLSDWFDSSADHYWHLDEQPHICSKVVWPEGALGVEIYPAYDLGYMLRKLPPYEPKSGDRIKTELEYHGGIGGGASRKWVARWYAVDDQGKHYIPFNVMADTPEDAAAALAIELFKKGVLTK